MDTRTGEILYGTDAALKRELGLQDEQFDKFIKPFNPNDATSEQIQNNAVSLHDAESKLGILRQNAIKQIGRNNPCPCKSGKKFKNCCLR